MFSESKVAPSVTTLGAPPVATPSDQPSGSSMSQIGAGPAALLYSLENELIKIYGELQTQFNKLTMEETNVQETTIVSGAEAQCDGASEQADALWCQAGGAIAGGVFTVASTAASAASMRSTNAKVNTISGEKGQLETLHDTACKVGREDPELKVSEEEMLPNQQREDRGKIAKARANELKNDIYTGSLEGTDKEALKLMKQNNELDKLREKLSNKISDKSRDINNAYSSSQQTTAQYNAAGQMCTQAATAISQGYQAGHTAQGGQDQAAQQVAQSTDQMAQSIAGDTRQAIGKFYDQIAGGLAAARAGAQANPQT